MAAAGQQIAAPTAAMSSVTAAPAAGPMQASKAENKAEKHQNEQAEQILKMVEIENASNAHYKQKKDAERAALAAGQKVDYRKRDPIAIKYAKQRSKALKKARKAFRWESYWNNKLDAQAEKTGEKSTANRGAAGMKMMDALAKKHTDESGKLDFFSYKDDVKLGTDFLHQADTSVLNWLDKDEILKSTGLEEGGLADAITRNIWEARLDNLSKSQLAEFRRINSDKNAEKEAKAKVRERYDPVKKRLYRETPWKR